jgi:hypothetical protein
MSCTSGAPHVRIGSESVANTTPDVEETARPDVARHDSQLTGRRPESCGELSFVHVGVEFSMEPTQAILARERGAESDAARSAAQDAAGGYVTTRRAERSLAQLVIPGLLHLGGPPRRLVAGRRRPRQAMESARASVPM